MPSISLNRTCGLETWNSNPSRLIFSIKTERWSSPLPLTLNESVESVSSTLSDTSVCNSLKSLALICLLVRNFPSLPANGLSFTEKFIEIVGSEIFTKSSGSGASVEAMVSPIFISSIPVIATIEPE